MFSRENQIKIILDKIICTSSSLIKLYPKYNSPGILESQLLLKEFMLTNKWDHVMLQSYKTEDIINNENYVDVKKYGSIYANYEEFDKYNLLGLIDSKKNGRTLILNGHIDVDIVDEKIAWDKNKGWRSGTVVNGKIFGRGSTDMLSGLSSLLHVANYFNKNKDLWNGKIVFVSAADEEIGGNGTLASLIKLQKEGWLTSNTECVIAEPTNNKLCPTSLGFIHLKFNFSGTPLHMSVAKKNNNALYKAIDFISEFENILEKILYNINYPNMSKNLRYNFGIVNGGIDSAIPIESLLLESTIFFPPQINKGQFINSLKLIIYEKYLNTVSVDESGFSFAGANFEITKFGKENDQKNNIFPSPCDARLFKLYDIPTTIFGPGSLKQAHSINEFIKITDIKKYINLLIKYMLNYFAAYD